MTSPFLKLAPRTLPAAIADNAETLARTSGVAAFLARPDQRFINLHAESFANDGQIATSYTGRPYEHISDAARDAADDDRHYCFTLMMDRGRARILNLLQYGGGLLDGDAEQDAADRRHDDSVRNWHGRIGL